MKSRFPISSFARPSASNRKTSRSRCVSCGSFAPIDDVASVPASTGSTYVLPPATACTARSRSSIGASLSTNPRTPGVERLGQERAVAVPRVEQDRGLGRRPLRAPRQLDPAELRHPDVDERDRGLASLDLLQRLFAVTRPRDDLDPAQGEELGHGLEHGRMVVGHDAGDGLGYGRGQRFGSRGIPDSGDGPGTARGISKQTPAANSCRVTFTGTSNTVRQTITPGTAPDGRLDQALVEAQLEQVLDASTTASS